MMMCTIFWLLIKTQRIWIRIVIIHSLAQFLGALCLTHDRRLGDPVGDFRQAYLLAIHRLTVHVYLATSAHVKVVFTIKIDDSRRIMAVLVIASILLNDLIWRALKLL